MTCSSPGTICNISFSSLKTLRVWANLRPLIGQSIAIHDSTVLAGYVGELDDAPFRSGKPYGLKSNIQQIGSNRKQFANRAFLL